MGRVNGQDYRRLFEPTKQTRFLRERNALLLEALTATRQAIIVLSARGTVLFCTEPARRCLKEYFEGPNRRNHKLPKKLSRWVQLQEAATAWSAGPSPLREPFFVERKDGKLAVHLLSDRTNDRRILVMEEQHAGHSVELLQAHLCLTPREAEVLFWVSQGKMNAGIAVLLGLSTATVEKHLEHILTKLKVETRTAAARCAYEVLNAQNRGRITMSHPKPPL